MAKMSVVFLVVAIATALVGFSGIGGPIINGLGKALFGFFLILFLISELFGREQA